MKLQVTHLFRTAGVASVLLVAVSAVAAAQRQRPALQAPPHATQAPKRPTAVAKGEARERREEPREAKPFAPGVAKHLGMTEEALESAYQAALKTDPKLSSGQFIAANILAKNLGSKDPKITTQAILGGLASGKSIGQTLRSLGLSAEEAKRAEAQARRDAREAGEEANEKPGSR